MSTTYHLVMVTVAGIQDYIFNSNRLTENIGASYLVKQATEGWCFEALKGIASRHNLGNNNEIKDEAIEGGALDAEVLYAGGGNTYLLFRTEELAKSFAGALSRRALQEAPGLRLFVSKVALKWETDLLSGKIKEVNELSNRKRSQINPAASLAGLGITVMCRSTSLPATHKDDGRPISGEVHAKIQAAKDANKELNETFKLQTGFEYTRSFDDLGAEKGLASLLGVVHADGDGIGKLFTDIRDRYKESSQNREYVRAMRKMSADLNTAATNAMQHMIDALQTRVENGVIEVKGVARAKITLRKYDGKDVLPMRPLVFGGDDVTFVCDGRLSWALAVAYQRAFEEETQKMTGRALTACAGIAIVKVKYPFARAYLLAEELTKSAKRFKKQKDLNASCLDWHLAFTGLHGDLDDILQREYEVEAGSLRLRPVSLASTEMNDSQQQNAPTNDTSKKDLRTWQTVEKLLKVFQSDDWLAKRNKMKALRDALRGGPAEVEHFCAQYDQKLPMHGDFRNGWYMNNGEPYCGLFDALEIADLYISLERA